MKQEIVETIGSQVLDQINQIPLIKQTADYVSGILRSPHLVEGLNAIYRNAVDMGLDHNAAQPFAMILYPMTRSFLTTTEREIPPYGFVLLTDHVAEELIAKKLPPPEQYKTFLDDVCDRPYEFPDSLDSVERALGNHVVERIGKDPKISGLIRLVESRTPKSRRDDSVVSCYTGIMDAIFSGIPRHLHTTQLYGALLYDFHSSRKHRVRKVTDNHPETVHNELVKWFKNVWTPAQKMQFEYDDELSTEYQIAANALEQIPFGEVPNRKVAKDEFNRPTLGKKIVPLKHTRGAVMHYATALETLRKAYSVIVMKANK